MNTIYIVEDDSEIREMEAYALKSSGFDVNAFDCGKSMDEAVKACVPDLFILDIMLPGEDGLSILKRLRAQENTRNVPVIMITAKSSELDKVKGLDAGADDYIAKPFGVLELISRVKALLRRSGGLNADSGEQKSVSLGGVVIDEGKRSVTAGGENVELTYKEYELLKLLVSNPGLVYSRQQILEKIWGIDFKMDTRTVDMHIKTLRQKLGACGAIIQTVRNVGYKAQ
ncbi:MAG: response regulator transcription factor [Fibrobacter sp.]|nr:response regulator transcription factor [Fibrobacter sp.]